MVNEVRWDDHERCTTRRSARAWLAQTKCWSGNGWLCGERYAHLVERQALRKVAGYRGMPILGAALRAFDAQSNRRVDDTLLPPLSDHQQFRAD